ncbi:MAG: hypothetical protein K8I27_00060 [Planctomycetes bacterium]|nr:hypothetical protein [Planctomycetota bacterium]
MYSTYLAQRRDKLGPQDSGEWPPVKFRHLPKPTKARTSPAPTVIASLIVLTGYVATALLLEAEFAALTVIVLSPAFAALGVAWIGQFRRMKDSESAWFGLGWGLVGYVAMIPVHPMLIVGFICAGLTGGGSTLGAWLATLAINRGAES